MLRVMRGCVRLDSESETIVTYEVGRALSTDRHPFFLDYPVARLVSRLQLTVRLK